MKYCKKESKFKRIYSRNNLPKVRVGTHNKSQLVQINEISFDSFTCEW